MKLHEKNIPKIEPLPKTSEVLHAAETHEDDIPFDPERDITAEDLQSIKENLQENFDHGDFKKFVYTLFPLLVLYPQRRDEFDLERKQLKVKEWLEKDYGHIFAGEQQKIKQSDLDICGVALFCFPELKKNLSLDNLRQKMREEIISMRTEKEWSSLSSIIFLHDLLFNKNQKWDDLDDQEILSIKETMEKDSLDFALSLYLLFATFPKLREKIRPHDNLAKEFKNELAKRREEGGWHGLFGNAMLLTLIYADHIEVTSDGQIKITPKPKPLPKEEPLPQRPA